MLVLTRKQNEKIRIGDDVTITVVRTKGKSVRLGIEAPKQMRVLRGEIVFDLDEPAESARRLPDEAIAVDPVPALEAAQGLPCEVARTSPPNALRGDDWPREIDAESERRQSPSAWSEDRRQQGPLSALVQARTAN